MKRGKCFVFFFISTTYFTYEHAMIKINLSVFQMICAV